MCKKPNVRLASDGVEASVEMTKASAEGRLQSQVDKKARAFDALMRRLLHVKSSGPYTRDEMNER